MCVAPPIQKYLIDALRPVVEQKNQLKDEAQAEGEDDCAVIYVQESREGAGLMTHIKTASSAIVTRSIAPLEYSPSCN